MGGQAKAKSLPGFWKVFASMRLGLVLMFLLAGAATLGVLLPQGVSGQNVLFGQFIKLIGLDRVFTTWWFRGLAYLLALNVLVCMVNRIGAVFHVLRFPKMTMGSIDRLKSYESFVSREKSEEVAERISQVLLANRYRVLQSQEDDQTLIYGDKQRMALVGPVLAHLGLLLLVAGLVWGSMTGLERTFVTGTGEDPVQLTKVKTGYGTDSGNMAVKAETIKQVSPMAGISDTRAALSITSNGKVLKNGDVSYNSPLRYNDVAVNLIAYVPTVVIGVDYNGKESLVPVRPSENASAILVPGSNGIYIYFSNISSNKRNPSVTYTIVQSGNPVPLEQHVLTAGQPPVQLINYPFSFSLQGYEDAVKLRVSRNPGIGLVLSGALMLVSGISMSLYLKYRKVWVSVISEAEQVLVQAGGFSYKYRAGYVSEFAALLDEMRG